MSKSTFAFGTAAGVFVKISSPLSNADLTGSSFFGSFGVGAVLTGINLLDPLTNTFAQAYGLTDNADKVVPTGANFLPTVSRMTVYNATTNKWNRVREDGQTGSVLVGQSIAANLNVAASLAEMAVSIRQMHKSINRPMWGDRQRSTLRVSGDFTPADVAAAPADVVGTESFSMIFNGSTWDRLREVAADGITTGIPSSGGYVFNGTNWDRIRSSTQTTGAVLVSQPPTDNYLQWEQRSAWATTVRARIN